MRERLASPLIWHSAGFVVLLLLTIALAVRLGMDWTAMDSHSGDVLAGKQIQLKALEIQTAPLRGIDQRVEKTRERCRRSTKNAFLPATPSSPAESAISRSRPACASRACNTRRARPAPTSVRFPWMPASAATIPPSCASSTALSEIRTFFIIRAMSFTSQQGGLVNLRLRVSTWLRAADAAASGLPSTPPPGQSVQNHPLPPRRANSHGPRSRH